MVFVTNTMRGKRKEVTAVVRACFELTTLHNQLLGLQITIKNEKERLHRPDTKNTADKGNLCDRHVKMLQGEQIEPLPKATTTTTQLPLAA